MIYWEPGIRSQGDCMNMESFIGNTILFKGLPEKQLKDLSGILMSHAFKRGQTIFSDGEEANGFYVLRSGRIKIFKLSYEGKEQILHIIGPGEPFGEVPVFAGEKFPAYAEAMEESEAIFFPKATFTELIKKDPLIAMNMLAILSRRLKQFTKLVESLSLKEVPQRLATYLLYLSEDTGSGNSVDLNIAKGQLASILGTIPETLSRILSKMVNQDLIRVQGRTIKIIDKKALEDLASGEKMLV
jgi:CRP/FNR family transcriptional regulator, dissimilatory nitrate respiration regulator